MSRVLVATAPFEGGYYSPIKDHSAPIRIYSDRWIEDDIIVRFGLPKKRQRLSRKQFRLVKRAAKRNAKEGFA